MADIILLEPRYGLANRIRVIASGLWYSEQYQKKINLVWNMDPGLNCPFEALFEPIENTVVIHRSIPPSFYRLRETFINLQLLAGRSVFNHLPGKYYLIDDRLIKNLKPDDAGFLWLDKKKQIPHFLTCEEFGNSIPFLKMLVPVSDLRSRTELACKSFNASTAGLHIRRTDHRYAIAKSPTRLFIEKIESDISTDSSINYFLSTDDQDLEKTLTDMFPEHIFSLPKNFTRNSPEGVRDALVDFYCLANTRIIYGSAGSSFSYLAARINGIKYQPLEI
jgi:hypothetical protein